VYVGVYVNVGVKVLVYVNVGVYVFVPPFVGVTVKVRVGVNVGLQHSTSVSTQFEAILASPVNPIKAWLETGTHPETGPHQVYDPEVMETLPRFHRTTEPGAPPGVHPPEQPP
jgi:hypothetical protein